MNKAINFQARDMKLFFKLFLTIITTFFLNSHLLAQNNIKELIDAGKTEEALKTINRRLDDIYSKRVKNRRIPAGFISMMTDQREVDLIRVYRERKPGEFFIEDNPELAELHYLAGISHLKKKQHRHSISHFFQSLRFKKNIGKPEASLFSELANAYRDSGNLKAYRDSLETAYSLAPDEYGYSLLLGRAYSLTPEYKKAIFHLERYIKNTEPMSEDKLYLIIAGLNETAGKYMETEKYYIEYLKKNPNDAHIHFALGDLAFRRTGNYQLAADSLRTALKELPEKEIFKKSKSLEYLGDISFHDLYYERAVKNYLGTIKYQEIINSEIKALKENLEKADKKITELKKSLLSNKNYDEFEEFQFNQDKKGKIEHNLKEKKYEYKRLNPGRVRWYIAESLVKLGRLEDAVPYYRECISFDYKSNLSRKNITKLKLKIKRGY